MSIPPKAEVIDSGITIRLEAEDLVYIATEIMPDELGIDPLTKKVVVVTDQQQMVENLARHLNDEGTNDQGWAPVWELLEKAFNEMHEQGDDGLAVVEEYEDEDEDEDS